jgi:hypothetical protein
VSRILWLTTVCAAGLACGVSAGAQTPSQTDPGTAAPPARSTRTTVYEAAFFAQYAPRTALDIARRVPGFQIDLGSTQSELGSVDVRGFAGTAGNVVINGARPSSKAETIDTTLSRIPAQRVVRVEVGPGDLFGSDYAGKSQVLNVILSEQGGIDANVTAVGRRWFTGYINRDISGSAVITRGPSSINLSAGTGRNKQFEEGTDELTDVATGELVEHRRKYNNYFNRDPYIAAGWSLERGSDKAFHLNARWQPTRFDLTQRNRVTPSDGPQHDDSLIQHYKDPLVELGGDVARPLAGGAIKFVALATRRKRNDFDNYLLRDGLIDDGAAVVGGFEQTVKARRDETIGRLSWSRPNLAGFSFEVGAEAAYNTLDYGLEFFEIDENGQRVRINLPLDDAKVKEKRTEVYVSAGKTLSPALRVDGGVNYEFSDLEVSGDASAKRVLKFLKPNLTLDWKPGGGWRTQASIKRTVAQLDFYDFVSAADLSSQRVNGGNENLEPQRTWEFRMTAEHPLFGQGLFKLDLGYDLVSKLQDRILICDEEDVEVCFDAPGNIGTGKRAFAQLTLDAPLTRLWNGLRVKFTGTVQRTRVKDPIYGTMRNFSGFFPDWEWNFDVRRDIGKFSYGFVIGDRDRFTFFRTDEFDVNFNGGPFGTAFIEYRFNPRTSLTLDLDNAVETSGNRNRLLFRPNRAQPDSVFDEFRHRDRHINVGLTLKQSFGGGGGAKVAKSE